MGLPEHVFEEGTTKECPDCHEILELDYEGVEWLHESGTAECAPIGWLFFDQFRFTNLVCDPCVTAEEWVAIDKDELRCAAIFRPQTFTCKRCGEDIR